MITESEVAAMVDDLGHEVEQWRKVADDLIAEVKHLRAMYDAQRALIDAQRVEIERLHARLYPPSADTEEETP